MGGSQACGNALERALTEASNLLGCKEYAKQDLHLFRDYILLLKQHDYQLLMLNIHALTIYKLTVGRDNIFRSHLDLVTLNGP